MPIRSAQSQLDQLYTVWDDLISGKVASYSIGDKNITLQNISDLRAIIKELEACVVASETGPVLPYMGGNANAPGPNNIGIRTTEWS